MGSFYGHVLPGSLFLLIGLWHIVGSISKYVSQPKDFHGRTWHPVGKSKGLRYVEIYVIIIGSFADMCIEFFYSTHLRFFADGGLNTSHLNDFEHAAMLLMFFILGLTMLVTETTDVLPLPEGGLHIIAAMAFTAEFLLFFFHSTSHAGLEGRYHQFLVILIGFCVLCAVLGAIFPKSFAIDLASSIFIMMQGAWFYQTAFSLYGSMLPGGCRTLPSGIECDSPVFEQRGQILANVELSGLVSLTFILVPLIYGLSTKMAASSLLLGSEADPGYDKSDLVLT